MDCNKDINKRSYVANDADYKGCYESNAVNAPYQDPLTGAHFSYMDIYRKLARLQLQRQNSSESLDERLHQIPDEKAAPNVLRKYQTTGSKKFLRALKDRYPGTRYVQTCVEESKQGSNVFNFKKDSHVVTHTLEAEKNSPTYLTTLGCKEESISLKKGKNENGKVSRSNCSEKPSKMINFI